MIGFQLKRLGILLFFALCLLLAACSSAPTSSSNQPSATNTQPPTATATPKAGNGHLAIGQTAKVGVWEATLNSVKTSAGDGQVNVPQNGQYLILDLTFKNTDTSDHTVSTAIQMTLKDSTGQIYQDTFVSLPGVTSPDSDVQGGDLVRGQVTYDVPLAQKGFTFTYAAVLVPGAATWDITIS